VYWFALLDQAIEADDAIGAAAARKELTVMGIEVRYDREILVPLGAMARRAHVPSKWLRQLAESGEIPHLNADGRILFNPSTVHRHLATLAAGGTQQKTEAERGEFNSRLAPPNIRKAGITPPPPCPPK
jgi:hypothetical protein